MPQSALPTWLHLPPALALGTEGTEHLRCLAFNLRVPAHRPEGMVPCIGSNGSSAHQHNIKSVPAQQHSHEPYHSTPVDWEGGAGVGVSDAWCHGPGQY